MSQPSLRLTFSGREIARLGDGVCTYIGLGIPTVERQSATHNFCESQEALMEDLGNQVVTWKITALYEFETYEQARRWLFKHIASFVKWQGDFRAIEDNQIIELPNALIEFGGDADALLGTSCQINYTLRAGRIDYKTFGIK